MYYVTQISTISYFIFYFKLCGGGVYVAFCTRREARDLPRYYEAREKARFSVGSY
jgi:hypothetical protein